MTNKGNQRTFLRLLKESKFMEERLKDIASFLQNENNGLNNIVRPLNELEQTRFDQEKKLLTMEEHLLYNIVKYLQISGHIQTTEGASSAAATTTSQGGSSAAAATTSSQGGSSAAAATTTSQGASSAATTTTRTSAEK